MSTIYGRDPIADEVSRVLGVLAQGRATAPRLESRHVDLKEEVGRRDERGGIVPGDARREPVARQLAGEAACMANTDGGGALIVGVADDGTVMGTDLDAEWLRGRIYDLTQRLLTVDVREVDVAGVRVLVVRSPQAIEPIRWNHKIHWRVDDRCVEIDAAAWHARRMNLQRYDWSELSSHVDPKEVRSEALALARRFLRESGESAAADLAAARDPDLLRRLNVVTADGYLTNAGTIAFVGRAAPAIDYVRREVTAGDSVARLRDPGRSLIEEMADVEELIGVHNGVRQVQRGLVVGRLRELPPLAIREAIVNGVVHRDWASAAPTFVEHVGRSLVVTSPGGFIGGVTSENIITHPSQARNRALAELFSSLRLAEREGIGVDRMVREMISVGYPAPDIREVAGPHVRAALVGETLDEPWIRFLGRLEPGSARDDLTVLLLLRRLVSHLWVDVSTAAPLLQRSAVEAEGAIEHLSLVHTASEPIIELVNGVPAGEPDAWQLTAAARSALREEDLDSGNQRRFPSREQVALDWARARGRVSTTELGSLVRAYPSNLGSVLKGLEERELLRPSRANRRGPGFFYAPTAVSPE